MCGALQLGDMEREVRGVRDPTRRELGNTIRQYKEALGQVQKDLDTAKGKFQRNALMSGASAGSIDVSTMPGHLIHVCSSANQELTDYFAVQRHQQITAPAFDRHEHPHGVGH